MKLAPDAFRRDYTLQALQDFHQCCSDAYREQGSLGVLLLWPLLFGETVTGLLAEYLSEIFGRKRLMLPTIRRSMIATFTAFVLFMLAYIALGRIADPIAPFDSIGRIYPQIGITHTILAHSGDIALLTIVLGGLPILFTAVSHAIRRGPGNVLKLFVIRPKHTVILLAASFIITICFLGYLLATQYLFGPPSCTQANGCLTGQPPLLLALSFAALVAAITAFVFVILTITTSLSLAVLRSEFSIELLRFSLVPVAVLALTMFAATLSATVWLVSLWVLVPQFAASGSGLGYGQSAWVIAIIAAMTIATLITIGAFGSGLKVSRIREA